MANEDVAAMYGTAALPDEVRQHLAVLEDRLAQLAGGAADEGAAGDLDRAFDMACAAAQAAGSSDDEAADEDVRTVTYGELIGERIRQLRTYCGWTQDGLAEAMRHLGFEWKRITVAEVERASRRVSLEELTALSALFAEPVLQLVLPGPGERVALAGERTLDPGDVGELWTGPDGEAGIGAGPRWGAAARIARVRDPGGEADVTLRPAAQLWRRRRRMGSTYGGRR